MKSWWTALFLLVASLQLLADVTKEEVRRLLDAHVSDPTIIAYVQKNGPMQPLSIEDVTELKKAGASDDVMRALLDASRPSEAVIPSPNSADGYSSESTVVYDSPGYYSY